MFRSRNEIEGNALLLNKESVVRAIPRAILRIGTRIFGQAAETNIPADRT
jgi:hypothetical protein